MRWQIAKETGWTLEYLDALSFEDVFEWLSINDADAQKKVGR